MRNANAGILCAIVLLAAGVPARAQWQVRTVDDTGFPITGINAGEALLASAATAGTGLPDFINYTNEADDGLVPGGTTFPGFSSPNDNFALEAVGLVDVIGGTAVTIAVGVNSNDGYRLRRNGTVVGEFTGVRDDPDAATELLFLTVNDGDVLRLTYFENTGGENLEFFRDNDGTLATTNDLTLIGSAASGIDIIPVPEPASLGLLGVGAVGLLARRRGR